MSTGCSIGDSCRGGGGDGNARRRGAQVLFGGAGLLRRARRLLLCVDRALPRGRERPCRGAAALASEKLSFGKLGQLILCVCVCFMHAGGRVMEEVRVCFRGRAKAGSKARRQRDRNSGRDRDRDGEI